MENGASEIADELFESGRLLKKRHPNALRYGVRIGYDAVLAVGGAIERYLEE